MSRANPWFKCFPADWIEGTRGLTPEQRGIYFDCLCLIYEHEAPLPKDDKLMSHALHVSTRLWRSVRDALIEAGKLVETDDGYVNERACSELGSRSVRGQVSAEPDLNQARTERENLKKPSKNYAGANASLRGQKQEDRSREDSSTVEQDAAGGRYAICKQALNGSTEVVLGEVAKHLQGDQAAAIEWTANTLTRVSGSALIRAYGMLIEKQAAKQVPRNVLAYLSTTGETETLKAKAKEAKAAEVDIGHKVSPTTVRFAKPANGGVIWEDTGAGHA